MKKNKILCISVLVFMLCSCAGKNYIKKTVWINATPVEYEGVKGTVVTSVYFWDKNTVEFYTAVEKDSIVVAPYLSLSGKYKSHGKIKNGVRITIDAQDSESHVFTYNGVLTSDGMILVSPDSIAKGYSLVNNATIK